MIVIRSGRHPFEIMMLVMLIVSGTSNSLTYDRTASNVVRQLLPELLGRAYYGLLAVGGLIALIGVFLHGLKGPMVERAGLFMVAGGTGAFAILLATFGWRAMFFALFVGGFAVGVIWRILQISHELKAVQAAMVLTPNDSAGDGT